MDNLTPEEIQQLAAMLSNEDSVGDLQTRIKYDRLRKPGIPQGTQAGNVYVAANPMEHLGNFLQGFTADRDAKKAQMQIDALRKQNDAARAAYMRRIPMMGQTPDDNQRIAPPYNGPV